MLHNSFEYIYICIHYLLIYIQLSHATERCTGFVCSYCVPETHAFMKEALSLPAHAANLVAIIGNTAYGVNSK